MNMNRRFRRKVRVGVHSGADERSKIVKIAVISFAVLVIVIVLTVIWGNSLKKKAENPGSEVTGGGEVTVSPGETTQNSTVNHVLPPSTYNASKVPVVRAKYITLSSFQSINWSDRAATLKKDGVTSVSLVLYYGGGTLNYSSKTAQAMAFQSSDTTKTNLYEAIGVLDVAGIYTSGCFYINYLTRQTPELVGIFRSYEAALMAEAVDAGFRDLLLFGFDCTEAAAIEALQLIETTKELESGAVVGIAIPCSAASSADADEIFSNFATASKFLALDLSSITTADALLGEVERASSYIKTYNLRLVIPESLASVCTELEADGYTNWQIVP